MHHPQGVLDTLEAVVCHANLQRNNVETCSLTQKLGSVPFARLGPVTSIQKRAAGTGFVFILPEPGTRGGGGGGGEYCWQHMCAGDIHPCGIGLPLCTSWTRPGFAISLILALYSA